MKQFINTLAVLVSVIVFCAGYAKADTTTTVIIITETTIEEDIETMVLSPNSKRDTSSNCTNNINNVDVNINTSAKPAVEKMAEKLAESPTAWIKNIDEARKYLLRARGNRDDNQQYIQWIREDLEKAGATPETIGTSEEELGQLLADGYIFEAEVYLRRARESRDNNQQYIQWIREDLEKAGATPETIGTSEKELTQLLVDGYIAEASKWLEMAEKNPGDNKLEIRFCLQSLQKANEARDF